MTRYFIQRRYETEWEDLHHRDITDEAVAKEILGKLQRIFSGVEYRVVKRVTTEEVIA